MAISSEEKTKLLKVVVGLFDAAPGSAFLPELEAVVDGGTSIRDLAKVLVTKSVFTGGVMGGVTTPAAQAEVLAGHFGLAADGVADSAASQAIAYFTAGIEGGANIGDLVTDAVEFLMRADLPTEFAETATLLANKAAVAGAYSAIAGNNSTDLAVLQAVMQDARITGTAPLTQAEINQIVADANRDVFTLTANTDVATANQFVAGLVFTPGGNDRINALQDEDVLTGVGDNPTLTATLGNANDNGATIITPTLNNIQTLNVAFTGSGANNAVEALDMQDATGLTSVNITRVSQAVDRAEIGNITSSAVNELSVSNTNANLNGTIEFSYVAGALAGENSATLDLDNVQIGTLNIGQNATGIANNDVSTQGYENLTLNSTGAANTVGTLNMPMDTGTAGVLTITGDTDLMLGAVRDAVNTANNALVEVKDLHVAGTGVALAGGRIATIDASALTGNFTIVLDNILDVGKADTSGVNQDVSVIGGAGDDTFVLYDVVQTGDSIDGGAGNDTLLFYSGSALNSLAGSIENAAMFGDGSIGNLAADFDNLPDVTSVTVRNISSDVDQANFGGDGVLENAADAPVSFTLTNLSDDQATGITVQHATTTNNQISNTVINAAIKNNTADNTLGVTIAEGFNTDPRFNFTIVTALSGNSSTFENVTLTDSASESNSVTLQNFAQHTGTVTITGGNSGDFISLDTDIRGAVLAADVTSVTTGITADNGNVQHGLLGLDVSGGNSDYAAGNIFDVAASTNQVRLGAAVIDASAAVSDVIVRVSTNAASATGAQHITMGSGNDTVIFDNLNDTRAGLTISDTVAGGDGNDTLVIDGNGVRINLSASEWTNVSGFENLRLVGNGSAVAGADVLYGQNQYNLTLTNSLIAANGSGMLNIINDNDSSNDVAAVVGSSVGHNTATTGAEDGVTIDARTLDASHHFSYNGEEGGWVDGNANGLYDIGEEVAGGTVDRFILSDANVNGRNIIDGGAVDNSFATWGANTDVLEIRNSAVATVGDLENLKNIGIIAGSNDQAVEQTLVLQLNDNVVDSMVDSYHTSSTTEQETLTVRVGQTNDITVPVAATALNFDGSALTQRSIVNITLDQNVGTTNDSIKLGMGLVTVLGGAGTGLDITGLHSAGFADEIVMSAAQFGIAAGAVGTEVTASGSNIVFGALGTGAATDRVYIVEGAAIAGYGGGANDIGIYYDADGSGAGAAILVGVLVDTAADTLSGGGAGITVVA
jgi:hypothetical protein